MTLFHFPIPGDAEDLGAGHNRGLLLLPEPALLRVSAMSLKRVAIIDHFSAGGVSRFLLALIVHMAQLHPETSFDYFVSAPNVERDNLPGAFGAYPNVTLVPIVPPRVPAPPADVTPVERGIVWRTIVGMLKKMPRVHAALRGALIAARERVSPTPVEEQWYHYRLDENTRAQIEQHDVAYIGWPYWIEPYDIGIPLVATFHDFHFRHFPEAYEPERLEIALRQTPEWLSRCTTAVTSTQFIKSELLEYYAASAPPVEVVYIAPYGFGAPERPVVEQVMARYGVKAPYVLYSGATTAHKNVASLIRATAILRDRGTPVQLVMTGHGTHAIGVSQAAGPEDPVQLATDVIAETRLESGHGYLALGYVSNEEVDALTVGASAIVSASLYEAGCGPALDAWQAGVPVAISRIPSFVEQTERFGVEAHLFDPLDPADIAEAIRAAVFDVDESRAMAERSRIALARYTWDDAARGYFEVLTRAAEAGRGDV